MLLEWQGILRFISGFSFDRVFFSVTVLWLLIKPMVKKAGQSHRLNHYNQSKIINI